MKPQPTGRTRTCPSCSWHIEFIPQCPLCGGTGIQKVTTPLSEQAVETRVKKWYASMGGLCLKETSASGAGLPDRHGILPGNNHAYWELKSGKHGKLSPLQKERIKELRSFGAPVYVVNSVETLEAAKIDALKHAQTK